MVLSFCRNRVQPGRAHNGERNGSGFFQHHMHKHVHSGQPPILLLDHGRVRSAGHHNMRVVCFNN